MPSPPPNPSSTKHTNNTSNAAPHASQPSDTSFRKTWDRTKYAQLATERESHEKATAQARYEAKLQGRKYHAPTTADPTSTSETLSRASRLDVSNLIGKTSLIPAGASLTGKRGRGAGFYCEACDLTFKDNLQFIDHLNSRQHLVATGQSGTVRKATVGEVRERLELLVARKRERERELEEGGVDGKVDLGKRLEARIKEEEKMKEEKRAERNAKRRKIREEGRGVDVKIEGELGVIC